jgi:murein DD-endopeptidase MepM/ murein hydrolase activator NlpD
MLTVSSRATRARRLVAARMALDRARGLAGSRTNPAAHAPTAPHPAGRVRIPADVGVRLSGHISLAALVVLILIGELFGLVSPLPEATSSPAAPGSSVPSTAPVSDCSLQVASGSDGALAPCPDVSQMALVLAPMQNLPGEPAEPILQRPLAIADAFQSYHILAADETLSDLALRYELPVETLVWANNLDRGDALMAGQMLRIPRAPGLSHTVAAGETLEQLAARFAVAPEAIATYEPNQIGDDLRLRPGVELFVPGGVRPLEADWLAALGGLEGLAGWGIEPAGIVRAEQTNLRSGPSTEHPRVAQLGAGRQPALRARHGDWLLVALGATRGWVRQDLLDLSAVDLATLPETNDFPPPPPRWVWPARGTLTSRFGPRWGAFHNGIDIANRAWAPIVAARAGQVYEAGWCSGYGYCVKMRHGGGVETIYGHLITRPVVRAGDQVAAGELIGNMGSTYDRAGGGYSTGVHLHFTITVNGRAVDPLRFLP